MLQDYEPLTIETLSQRLGNIKILKQKLGDDPSLWSCDEVGDGNLNLVFIVKGSKGNIIVKQALPYVRVVGESWPLSLKRVFFEHEALQRQAKYTTNMVPEIYYFDAQQAILVMEFMQPHIILRHSLKDGIKHNNLAKDMGIFCAQTLFRGSDLSLDASVKKSDLAIFADNIDLCKITEDLVFTDPYYNADTNNINSPALNDLVDDFRQDITLKIAVQQLKAKFCTLNETLLHGDLHTGSIMVTENDTSVIDPEFATYGPMGFDIGMLLANFWMAYFAQQGHQSANNNREDYRDWILGVTANIWQNFEQEFSRLWYSERNGILFDKNLFEEQNHQSGSRQALEQKLKSIWQDCCGFAGAEMIRRTIGLAHIIEVDLIKNVNIRTIIEKRCLIMGRKLIVQQSEFNNISSIIKLAKQIEKDNRL